MKLNVGLNNVNRDTIANLMPEYGHIIIALCNRSLQTGVFPDALKFTIITPIPKVKGSNRAEDMRPVNQACTLDKLLRIIIDFLPNSFIHMKPHSI